MNTERTKTTRFMKKVIPMILVITSITTSTITSYASNFTTKEIEHKVENLKDKSGVISVDIPQGQKVYGIVEIITDNGTATGEYNKKTNKIDITYRADKPNKETKEVTISKTSPSDYFPDMNYSSDGWEGVLKKSTTVINKRSLTETELRQEMIELTGGVIDASIPIFDNGSQWELSSTLAHGGANNIWFNNNSQFRILNPLTRIPEFGGETASSKYMFDSLMKEKGTLSSIPTYEQEAISRNNENVFITFKFLGSTNYPPNSAHTQGKDPWVNIQLPHKITGAYRKDGYKAYMKGTVSRYPIENQKFNMNMKIKYKDTATPIVEIDDSYLKDNYIKNNINSNKVALKVTTENKLWNIEKITTSIKLPNGKYTNKRKISINDEQARLTLGDILNENQLTSGKYEILLEIQADGKTVTNKVNMNIDNTSPIVRVSK